MVIEGDNILAFRLLTLRSALKLEAVGMKRRGRSALAIIREETGLKARTAKDMLPLYTQWLADNNIGR